MDMLKAFLLSAFIAGLGVMMLWWLGPDFVQDWQMQSAVAPNDNVQLSNGKCQSKLVVSWCSVTLQQGTAKRDHDFMFFDFSFGDHEANTLQGTTDPSYLTTDLAMNSLVNRLITLLLFAGGFIGLGVVAFISAIRNQSKDEG
jgi:hypothetical protein